MSPRSEPLLWLQLLGLAAIPAELLAVVLILAGADPGPVPAIERLLLWALGALLPAVLLWQRPADCWSLLLLQTPARGRREAQQRLSALQSPLPVRLLAAAWALLLLPAIWRLDSLSAQMAAIAPLPEASRLVTILLSVPLLAILVWQGQQLVQAVWLFSRSPEQVGGTPAMGPEALGRERLSLGLPLLLPDPLSLVQDRQPKAAPSSSSAVAPEQQAKTDEGAQLDEQVS
ncbi:low-complexity tail membrane protein [Synechococcus sp. EJ6-Ellesmere]|uniref:low-complexity tail membrane protein n=1 Tax=Synechococcus sp. EJ6-Ellesmere TaxID=2823734 RepID=UPI0020CD04A4|nr:low-complexity tail membrane protein [Synechococcus sp. EJ6-Ellesmere]MCP9823826.1 low-complexity tail membrane protein [Synechococcus sp. EJ6-Ellesmere]